MSIARRRRLPRIATSIKVNFDHGMESFTEFTLNLSSGGLFIKTVQPLGIGSDITVDFTLPGFDHPFQIAGKIIWIRTVENSEGPPGMGIKFTNMQKVDEDILVQYVARSQMTRKAY